MSNIEAKLQAKGLVLPEATKPPPGVKLPFAWVRVRGNRALVSGHSAVNPDGSLAHVSAHPPSSNKHATGDRASGLFRPQR